MYSGGKKEREARKRLKRKKRREVRENESRNVFFFFFVQEQEMYKCPIKLKHKTAMETELSLLIFTVIDYARGYSIFWCITALQDIRHEQRWRGQGRGKKTDFQMADDDTDERKYFELRENMWAKGCRINGGKSQKHQTENKRTTLPHWWMVYFLSPVW